MCKVDTKFETKKKGERSPFLKKCSGLDSNQHTCWHHPLKMACLPISPPEHLEPAARLKKKALIEGLGDPAGTRTQGPYIKSVLLYQLSYEINLLLAKRVQI
jgi:hypothetical protein